MIPVHLDVEYTPGWGTQIPWQNIFPLEGTFILKVKTSEVQTKRP